MPTEDNRDILMYMQKETKEQREMRSIAEAAQERAQQQSMQDTWPQRLMTVLERAQQVNAFVEIVAAEMNFKVVFRNSGAVHDVPYHHDPVLWSEDLLHDLDREVKDAEYEQARRMEAVRQGALAKLSMEEQKALGLISQQ